MGIKTQASTFAVNQLLDYAIKNPEDNIPKLMNWADRLDEAMGNNFPNQRKVVRERVVDDPGSNWYQLLMSLLRDVDPDVFKTIFTNFIVNANLVGAKRQKEMRAKYNCNIPWAILLDPTSACNLHCIGCWAAEYGNRLNLTFDELDSIVTQGKELGTFVYLFTGGEPLVRKKDIIALCEKHNDCVFISFTNGTLIDDAFAEEMLRVKNFIPAISLEGFEEATDGRRGEGTYGHVTCAMKILREHRLPFGISACYTSANTASIMSEEFMDFIIESGAYFIWFFHYMPVGNDATPELLPSPEQREYVYHKIRDEYRNTKAIFAIDFQNDGEYVGGCIAGGRLYFHINANGDCDPCAFIHYADSNIREKTLLEALRSPLFQGYHDNQPFNENLLRPCPMLENPDAIEHLVAESGAHSTDLQSPEPVEHLTAKTHSYADNWADTAERLWVCSGHCPTCAASPEEERCAS